MTSNLKRLLAALATLGVLSAGCAPDKTAGSSTKPFSVVTDGRTPSKLDAPIAVQTVFSVDVFVLSVPAGSLSGNEEFWKRIDEHALDDPGTYDLLYRSGVRVGKAPIAELAGLDKYMDSAIQKQRFSVSGTEVKDMQIEMKKDVIEQDIWYLDRFNERVGRTYQDSTNFLNISFEPARHKQGQLRLTCCPMVRSMASFLRATLMNGTTTVTREIPTALFDLNFKVDLSPDDFLIAMPSPDATTSDVGGAFFTKAGNAAKMEQVLIVMTKTHELQIGKPIESASR